jgi:multiple sugar transport system permease protein
MFDFSPTLYVLLMILFATASFFILRKVNQRRKRFASKYPNLSKNERLERLKQERLELAQAKKDMRKAIKAKKAEWKAEDKKADEIARANVLALKAEVKESKAEFEKVKAEYLADKENPEKEALYLETMKKHDRLCQKLRIEKERISLLRRIERWSKRGGRLRRELFIKRQYYYLVTPYALLFILFTVIPVAMSLILSFTYFNLLEFPSWVGWENYMRLFVDDKVFIIAIRNTLILAVITGPLSYLSAFVFAWLINELRPKLRAFMTLIFYAPSISGNVYLVWKLIFSSDMYGYANAFLLSYNFIDEPILWLQDPKYIIWIIMLVQLWLSLGVSFLAFIAGLQSVNRELYEAGAIDGIKNRWQELWFITLPQMKSQLMFGAVMQITSSLAIAEVATQLAGFPSIEYAGHTIITHLMDYGSLRMEMGYASSIATILFFMMIGANLLVRKILRRVGS